MAKLAELVSNVKVSSKKNDVSAKITREVNSANRPAKVEVLTKAEAKGIETHFVEKNQAARENELAFQRKREQEAKEKRQKREAEKKAALEANA